MLLPTACTKRIRVLRPHEKHHPMSHVTNARRRRGERRAPPPRARHRCSRLPGDRVARARPPGGRGGPRGSECVAAGAGTAPCGRGGRAHHRGAGRRSGACPGVTSVVAGVEVAHRAPKARRARETVPVQRAKRNGRPETRKEGIQSNVDGVGARRCCCRMAPDPHESSQEGLLGRSAPAQTQQSTCIRRGNGD